MRCREGEVTEYRKRTDRFSHVDGAWYFSTREGPEMGPYETKVEAKSALSEYIACMQDPERNIYYPSTFLPDSVTRQNGFQYRCH